MKRSSTGLPRAGLSGLAVIATVVACSGPTEKGAIVPAESSDPPLTSPQPEARRGKLAAAPPSRPLGQFWPTRICTRGPAAFIVQNSCACDSRMTCIATRRGNVLDLHVGMTQEICKDCGTFSATCTVPADLRPRVGSTRAVRIAIDGKPVLEALEVPTTDAPTAQRCYE